MLCSAVLDWSNCELMMVRFCLRVLSAGAQTLAATTVVVDIAIIVVIIAILMKPSGKTPTSSIVVVGRVWCKLH